MEIQNGKSKTTFYVAGSQEACLEFFKQHSHDFMVTFSTITLLLTKGATFGLYLSEHIDEVQHLGESIYKFAVDTYILDDISLIEYITDHCTLVPNVRVQKIL